jgi:hypothetical protein
MSPQPMGQHDLFPHRIAMHRFFAKMRRINFVIAWLIRLR